MAVPCTAGTPTGMRTKRRAARARKGEISDAHRRRRSPPSRGIRARKVTPWPSVTRQPSRTFLSRRSAFSPLSSSSCRRLDSKSRRPIRSSATCQPPTLPSIRANGSRQCPSPRAHSSSPAPESRESECLNPRYSSAIAARSNSLRVLKSRIASAGGQSRPSRAGDQGQGMNASSRAHWCPLVSLTTNCLKWRSSLFVTNDS